jgi:ABC-type branched-subunit amino acid transport system ATPase component
MAESTAPDGPLLTLRGIHKRFPGVHALRGVELDVRRGEVHAVVGENGAGKSTLMQIVAGVYPPDAGRIDFDGRQEIALADEHAAQELGIALVYQERSLFGPMSVAENVFAARQPVTRWGHIDRAELAARTGALLDEVGLAVAVDAPVETLSPARQQLVEIAKALSLGPKLILLDEPTAALTPVETDRLFELVRRLRDRQVGVIYISHRLEEVFAIADRVTVLKDGAGQGTFGIRELTPGALAARMVGRDVSPHAPRQLLGTRRRGRRAGRDHRRRPDGAGVGPVRGPRRRDGRGPGRRPAGGAGEPDGRDRRGDRLSAGGPPGRRAVPGHECGGQRRRRGGRPVRVVVVRRPPAAGRRPGAVRRPPRRLPRAGRAGPQPERRQPAEGAPGPVAPGPAARADRGRADARR